MKVEIDKYEKDDVRIGHQLVVHIIKEKKHGTSNMGTKRAKRTSKAPEWFSSWEKENQNKIPAWFAKWEKEKFDVFVTKMEKVIVLNNLKTE